MSRRTGPATRGADPRQPARYRSLGRSPPAARPSTPAAGRTSCRPSKPESRPDGAVRSEGQDESKEVDPGPQWVTCIKHRSYAISSASGLRLLSVIHESMVRGRRYGKGARSMPRFLTQFAYTREAWQALVKNPMDREAAFRRLVEQMGGTFTSLDYCFGDYDGVVIFEPPNSEAALSMVLAVITPGHLRATKTTELFTMREMTGALKVASGVHYPGPE